MKKLEDKIISYFEDVLIKSTKKDTRRKYQKPDTIKYQRDGPVSVNGEEMDNG